MPLDVWTQMITSDHSLRNKSPRARKKVTHVELLRAFVWPVPQYAVTVIYKNQQHKKAKDFLFSKKRAKLKTKTYIDDFRKVVISN